MQARHVPGLVLSLLLVFPDPLAAAATQDSTEAATRATLALSPELQQLIREEMTAIQSGMQSLLTDIASGHWDGVAETGEKLKHTYIFKQQLTVDLRQELHRKLPPAFRELDQAFHEDAGKLAHAAQEKNAEVVNFYFHRLVDGCVTCHARFATRRFPAFSITGGRTDHDH